jgi:hypothetical protein
MGYLWQPWFNLSVGGKKNLRTAMPYAGGPIRIELNYIPVFERRETVSKSVNILHYGYRVNVAMTFAAGGSMADHAVLADIVNALTDPAKTVDLSLQGDTNYRRVELRRYDGPDPFDGKTFAGAYFRLEVETQDLIATVPAIGSGVW